MIFRPAFDFAGSITESQFMKEEKKYIYELTKREAHATQDACNRIKADSPENLGVSDGQFDACDRAAYALARPAIDSSKILLIYMPFEFRQLYLFSQTV